MSFFYTKLDEKSGNDVKFRHMRSSAFQDKKVYMNDENVELTSKYLTSKKFKYYITMREKID